MADDTAQPLLRAMDDKEIRLNCVALACSATTYMRGRMTDPLTVAEEFYAWIIKGEKPAPAGVQFGDERAAPEPTSGFESGITSPSEEAVRAAGGDLIQVGGPPSVRQGRRSN